MGNDFDLTKMRTMMNEVLEAIGTQPQSEWKVYVDKLREYGKQYPELFRNILKADMQRTVSLCRIFSIDPQELLDEGVSIDKMVSH